ncbi:TolC family outer membrane protein [Porticoccaceae bacterium]|nr:TolC family outer membrane protein [Porticoccaceae bacterium]MDB4076530.1 TolC family outer membrane protein [Porticoccaceae bacterium]MDB4262712.1 TolC family outer membrane protein [Porticoccaceae bacterium]MDB9953379.1 TolC family outer membrane protein [Porticoccaceae bacterium]MDB9999044.1 TolC family outer membrane protein [Porticoccaceae bacterium]
MRLVKQGLFAISTALLVAQISTADTLNDIYESALLNDPVLRAARASFNAERETKNIARGALLPQLAISGDYTESEINDNPPSVITGLIDTNTTTYGVSLSQAFFDMPSWYSFKSGKALSDSAQAQFAADQQSLIIRVSEAYFNVLRAYDNLQTRSAEQRAIQRQLEQTRERFEVGLLPVTDVHEAQAVFDDAAVNSLEARGALNIAFEGLQVLTGQDHEALAGLTDTFMATNPEPLSNQEWVDFAIGNNFQLKVAELGKDAAYNSAKAAASARLPKITGRASYYESDMDGTRYTNPIETQQDGHSFVVSVTMPIWMGGSVDAKRRQAKQLSIASKEGYAATKRNIIQASRSLHQLVLTNTARVKARKQSITSADSALQATQAGYEVGTRNIVDVLVAQRSVYQARRNYANARYDYILSMMRLKEVAGQLAPDDIYQLNGWLDSQLIIAK